MYTTYSENGILNNYSNEPDMYYAVSPSLEQQANYFKQGLVAFALVVATLLTAVAVS